MSKLNLNDPKYKDTLAMKQWEQIKHEYSKELEQIRFNTERDIRIFGVTSVKTKREQKNIIEKMRNQLRRMNNEEKV